MSIDPQLVKKLRDQTGAGMLDVKNALEATNGDYNKAIIWLEEKGVAKANKKAGRIAADGLVKAIAHGNKAVIFELNCETDFVALTDDFKHLMNKIGNAIINSKTELNKAEDIIVDGKPIAEVTTAATAKIGEKISFRRFNVVHKSDNQVFGVYNHANGKISSILVLETDKEEVAKNVSMHLTAMNPSYMTKDHVPHDVISKHKKDIMAEMQDVRKQDNIKEMMAEGKLKKILSEVVLLEQEFVMEAKKSVANYLKDHNAVYISAIRYEVGEGTEKIEVDFASEVKSQMR